MIRVCRLALDAVDLQVSVYHVFLRCKVKRGFLLGCPDAALAEVRGDKEANQQRRFRQAEILKK
jgi:hypothetical protein